jgi:hypothetical protein
MKKSVITCLMLVLAFGGIGLFRVPRVSAQSATTTEFDLALHCAGPAPVSGSAQLTVQMSPAIMATPYQLNCSDSTDRGATSTLFSLEHLLAFRERYRPTEMEWGPAAPSPGPVYLSRLLARTGPVLRHAAYVSPYNENKMQVSCHE